MAAKISEDRFWQAAAAIMALLLIVVVALNVVKWTSPDFNIAGDLETAEAPEVTTVVDAVTAAPASTQTLMVEVSASGITAEGSAADDSAVLAMGAPVAGLYSGTAEFEVSSGDEPAWMSSYRDVILQLGFFSEATLEVTATETKLNGKVPSNKDLRAMERLLTEARGFPTPVINVEVTDQKVSRLNVTANQSQVTVSGDVPSETLKQNLLASIRNEYGTASVVDVVSVDSSLASQLNLLRFAADVEAMSAFDSYTISYSQGNSFTVITGGVEFIAGGTNLTAKSKAAVSTLPAFLQRTDLKVRVIGHEGQNVDTVHSIDRAKAVANQLLLSDVSSEQVIVIGRGDREEEAAEIDGAAVSERSVDIEIGSAIT